MSSRGSFGDKEGKLSKEVIAVGNTLSGADIDKLADEKLVVKMRT